jgi:hypothetical protein
MSMTPLGRSRGTSVAAIVVALLSLVAYLLTAAPTVLPGDSGELQTVGLLGGVAHSSGYPTFILLGQVFGRLIPGDPAHRITVMSAVFGSIGVLAFGLLLAELGLAIPAVAAGALLLATSFTMWWSATRAEVYTLAVACFFLALIAATRALRTGRREPAVAASLLLGLTLTSHMAYAPPAALTMLMLAWRTRANRKTWWQMGLGFLAGLLPILYLVYADARTEATNYLKTTIEFQSHEFGLAAETFHAAWQRIPWLVLGREAGMGTHLGNPLDMARNAADLLAYTFLFEVGPLALVPLAIAIGARCRRPRATDWLFCGILVLSFGFAIASGDRRVTPIYALPYSLMIVTLMAIGLDRLIEAAGPRPLSRWLTALVAFVLIAPLPHALRAHAARHPIGPRGWQVIEEGPPPVTSFVPRLDQYRETREVSENLLRLAPHGAFVVGDWDAIKPLEYLQLVEGRRPDLTFDTFHYPWHLPRLQRWQERHDLRARPIVVIGRAIQRLQPYLDRADTLAYAPGLYGCVQRTPLRSPPHDARP